MTQSETRIVLRSVQAGEGNDISLGVTVTADKQAAQAHILTGPRTALPGPEPPAVPDPLQYVQAQVRCRGAVDTDFLVGPKVTGC